MSKAKSSVFLTAAFGVSTQFAEIFFKEKGYLRYLLLESKGRGRSVGYVNKISENEYNRIALGAIIESNNLENWHKENLTNLNRHVRYIHTKYMLVDPLSDNPITITGSANFSEASTKSNDENMLIIRGNKRVADIYIGEYMRLFKHFYFRNKINQEKYKKASTGDGKPRKKYLKSTDYWTKKYYVKNSVREKERLLFNGKRS
jgi:phosphatidylserine/phosphatidylglycerophosphate/cardiolipin synthase-like enzyme